MEFKNREIKLSQEASDDKSGAFSFNLKLKITQEAVNKISACDFYINSVDIETGEMKKSKKDWIRALAMTNLIIGLDSTKEKSIGSRTFKDIKEDYHTILDNLISIGIVDVVSEAKLGKAGKYIVKKEYVGETTLKVSKKEKELFYISFKKEENRGKKVTTDGFISIDLTFDMFSKLYDDEQKRRKLILNYKKRKDESNSKEDMWKTIQEINKTGKIDPHGKKEKRIYSKFTNLSSFVHPYVKINGQNVSELDLHATYWQLLPAYLEKNKSIAKSEDKIIVELNKELDNFRRFLSQSNNVYEEIGLKIGASKDDVKQNSMVYICEKQPNMSGIAKQIQDWMKKEYPEMNHLLNFFRKESRVSNRLQEIESALFVTAARKFKKAGYGGITKHDSILCFEEHVGICEAFLKVEFAKKGILYRCRVKSSSCASHQPSVDQGFNEESDFVAKSKIHPVYNGEGGTSIRANFDKSATKSATKKDKPMSVSIVKDHGSNAWFGRYNGKSYKKSCKKCKTEQEFREFVLSESATKKENIEKLGTKIRPKEESSESMSEAKLTKRR